MDPTAKFVFIKVSILSFIIQKKKKKQIFTPQL